MLVPEYCRSLDEDEIIRSAFDLIFAFDEVISVGHREKVSVSQVKTFTQMESQEEKFHEMMERTRRQEVLELAKRREYEIEQQKLEPNYNPYPPAVRSHQTPSPQPTSAPSISSMSSQYSPSYLDPAPRVAPKGMVLQKPVGGDAFERQLQKDGISLAQPSHSSTPSPSTSASPSVLSPDPQVPRKSVHISLSEVFNASVSREGGINSLSVAGDLALLISDPNSAHIAVKLSNCDQAKASGFTFEAHPNINRSAFEQGIIVHRDPSRPLAVGNAFRVFKWRLGKGAIDESMLPLRLTCWPSATGDGRSTVALDFELVVQSLTLLNLVIEIPIPTSGAAPIIDEIEGGSTAFDGRASLLRWSIPLVDAKSSSTGRLEFTMPSLHHDGLFPIKLRMNSSSLLCPIVPQAVATTKDAQPIEFSVEKHFNVENYSIE